MKKKGLALVLALTLLVVGVVAGTLAWLTAKSDVVTNTFTTSDIKVELKETTGTTYKMIPGYTISKDPKATVLSGSEECYLFVKLEKSQNFDTFLTYEMAEGWMKLDGVTDTVYYRVVDGTTNQIGKAYNVLANDQVTVKGEVTKERMKALTTDTYPTLTITAYASQLYKNNNATDNTFTAAQAWKNAQSTPAP